MADIRINEGAPVVAMNDDEYIVIILTDGTIGRIKRSNLLLISMDETEFNGHKFKAVVTTFELKEMFHNHLAH